MYDRGWEESVNFTQFPTCLIVNRTFSLSLSLSISEVQDLQGSGNNRTHEEARWVLGMDIPGIANGAPFIAEANRKLPGGSNGEDFRGGVGVQGGGRVVK